MAATLETLFSTLPLTTSNRAQLNRIGYVADDMAALRARLLARLAETFPQWNPILAENVGDPDFGVLFVDLFTQMTAILNAYSDARMNESLLRTAQLERSLIDLAALLDYRLVPGASAAGLQAFLVKDGASGSLPANFKVQAPAVGATPTVVFETLASLAVASVRNRLRHYGYDRSGRVLLLRNSAVATQDQTALLNARYRSLRTGVPMIFDGGSFRETIALNASQETDGKTQIVWSPGVASADRDAPIADLTVYARPKLNMRIVDSARADELTLGSTDVPVAKPGYFDDGAVVLVKSDGVLMAARVLGRNSITHTLTLSKGLIASLRRSATTVTRAAHIGRASSRLRPGATSLTSATAFPAGNTPQSGDYLLLADASGIEVTTVAYVQGNTIVLSAPLNRALRATHGFTAGGGFSISGAAGIYLFRVAARNPAHSSAARVMRVGDLPGVYQAGSTVLNLDKSYDGLTEKSLVAASDGQHHYSYVVRSAQTVEGKTRLIVNGTVAGTLRVAQLQIFAGFEYAMRIDGYDRADGELIAGTSQLRLIGTGLGFSAGAYVILDDGAVGQSASGVRLTQVAESNGVTLVSLARPLERKFQLADTIVYGNIVPTSHGASVAEEVLGSGNPDMPNQRFALRRTPVSFAPDATQPRGVSADLEVFVDDKRWTEVTSLADSAADDEHYVLEIDDEKITTVCFGDGMHGAPPSSGRNNIRARYRVGSGELGNVAVGALKQMPQALPFIATTVNPGATSGGVERETPERAKRGIAVRVRTLDRAVSLIDYAGLALTFSGVAKARAEFSRDKNTGVRMIMLTIAASGGAALSATAKDALYSFFSSRAPLRPTLVIRDARRIAVKVALHVTLLNNFLQAQVLQRLLAALGSDLDSAGEFAYFNFERRGLGDDLYLSDLYAAIEVIEGVDHVLATAFHPEAATPAVLDRIRMDADAWASGGDPVDADIGRLGITLDGGLL